MSKKLVTKEIPDILPVSAENLSSLEVWLLLKQYDVKNPAEFVVCRRKMETILVNKELPDIEETIQLINRIMAVKYLDKAEGLFEQFKKLQGERASTVLLYIWMGWRKERQAADLNKRALNTLNEIKRNRLVRKSRKEKDMISELFDIGFGVYNDEAKCDWDKGKEYVFEYGYMQGMKAAKAEMKARAAV
ncbi:MAG: hypothetical protein ACLU9Q_10350 [Marvinbryantia sp.]|uniref:hypothetical protein n=1 Tax=Marvinbryantia sp. TaxID=2496532 RepID=UPI0025D7D3DE|nr:hypothetical protein [uncultured Marvinbryantia sp.]